VQFRLYRLFNNASANLRGMIWMLGATLLFAAMHGAIRHIAQDVHPTEIAFFRNFLGLIFLSPLFIRYGVAPLRTPRFGMHFIRAILNVGNMIAYYIGLSLTPLAEATALNFTAPLFTTLLATVFLGETLRLRRTTALLFGFLGALVILRPGMAEMNIGAVLVVVSALIWGGIMVMIKVMSRTDSALTITLWMVLLMSVMSLPPALPFWTWPTWIEWGWLTFIGVTGTIAQLLITQAIKEAEATSIMPIDFFRLIWATLIGYLAFTEVPDLFTWVGGTMIFGSAIYIAFREKKLHRDRKSG
jgi:drug/metabolite transporter (DMT)-like permease